MQAKETNQHVKVNTEGNIFVNPKDLEQKIWLGGDKKNYPKVMTEKGPAINTCARIE
jgi:hypothetical protein